MADETPTPEEPKVEATPKAAAKPAAAKKPAAKKPAAAKTTAAAKADDAEAKPAAKKPAAKKPAAAKTTAAAKADDAEAKPAAKKPAAKTTAAAKAEAADAEAPAKADKPAKTETAVKTPDKSLDRAARRREARSRGGNEKLTIRAQAKYVRSSARKARLVCDHIREQPVDKARAILTHSPRAVARDWSKLLESAVANAEHNHALDAEDLKIVAVFADEGPTLKRFQPRAQGRAFRIRKRTAHLTILLGSKE